MLTHARTLVQTPVPTLRLALFHPLTATRTHTHARTHTHPCTHSPSYANRCTDTQSRSLSKQSPCFTILSDQLANFVGSFFRLSLMNDFFFVRWRMIPFSSIFNSPFHYNCHSQLEKPNSRAHLPIDPSHCERDPKMKPTCQDAELFTWLYLVTAIALWWISTKKMTY